MAKKRSSLTRRNYLRQFVKSIDKRLKEIEELNKKLEEKKKNLNY
jgi:hypothetical protein